MCHILSYCETYHRLSPPHHRRASVANSLAFVVFVFIIIGVVATAK